MSDLGLLDHSIVTTLRHRGRGPAGVGIRVLSLGSVRLILISIMILRHPRVIHLTSTSRRHSARIQVLDVCLAVLTPTVHVRHGRVAWARLVSASGHIARNVVVVAGRVRSIVALETSQGVVAACFGVEVRIQVTVHIARTCGLVVLRVGRRGAGMTKHHMAAAVGVGVGHDEDVLDAAAM